MSTRLGSPIPSGDGVSTTTGASYGGGLVKGAHLGKQQERMYRTASITQTLEKGLHKLPRWNYNISQFFSVSLHSTKDRIVTNPVQPRENPPCPHPVLVRVGLSQDHTALLPSVLWS